MNERRDQAGLLGSVPEGNNNGAPIPLGERVRSLRLPEPPVRTGGLSPWLVLFVAALVLGELALGAGLYVVANRTPSVEDLAKVVEMAPKTTPATQETDMPLPRPEPALAPGAVVLESKGYIIPVHQIQVSPKVSGMVMELNIEEGQRVPKDFVLAKLEITEYKAEHDRAQALAQAARHRWQELWKYRNDEIRQAKAELEDARAQREQLWAEWKRSTVLKTTGSVAQRDYELAESQFKSQEQRSERLKLALDLLTKGPRDERIAAAKSEVEQAEAELSKAKWRLDNCTVLAPVAGTILTKKTEKGSMVNPAAFSNGLAASICDMADLSDMEVDLSVPERDIGKVFKGQKCKVRAEAFPTRAYDGYVSRLMPTADRAKGAVPVRVKIIIPAAEEGQYLRPEMGAVVTFFNEKVGEKK